MILPQRRVSEVYLVNGGGLYWIVARVWVSNDGLVNLNLPKIQSTPLGNQGEPEGTRISCPLVENPQHKN
jgi:hypothetical protein